MKRIIALIISVALLVPALCVALATGGSVYSEVNSVAAAGELLQNGADERYPTIILPGISQSTSYLANDDGSVAVNSKGQELSGGLLIIDSSNIVAPALKYMLMPLLCTLLTQNSIGIRNGAYNLAKTVFDIQATNKDGTPKHNLQTVTFPYPVSQMSPEDRGRFYRNVPMQEYTAAAGEDMVYLYTFPLIGDPMKSAEGLNDFVQMVKEQTGKSKVNLVTLSLGGTILTAYLDLPQTDYNDINKIVNIVSLLDGTDLFGDFFERSFNLDDEFLYSEYLPMVMKETNGSPTLGYVINLALRILPKRAVEHLLTGAMDGILETLVLHCPQFWAMVPNDRYNALAERYLSGSDCATLRAKTDRFHMAQTNLKANLLELKNTYGVTTNNICGYGLDFGKLDYNFFAIMASNKTTNSDGIINLESTSLGATCARAGGKLPDSVLNDPTKDGYISPDGSVDASTAIFPDNVWYFYDHHHEAGRCDATIKLATRLILGTITDVNSDPENYPQFNKGRITYKITRDYLPKAKEALNNRAAFPNATAEQWKELEAAVAESEEMLSVTNVWKAKESEPIRIRLLTILHEFYPEFGVPAEQTAGEKRTEAVLKFLSDAVMKYWGGRGYSDWFYDKVYY